MIRINIPFDPVPWAAPKLGRNFAYDPRERDKRVIRYLIKEQYKEPPLDEYVILVFKYAFKPPASTSKKKRELMLAREIYPTRCDCTNLQKLYEDCLQGIVIKNDKEVIITMSEKFYAEKPSVEISVHKYSDYGTPCKS